MTKRKRWPLVLCLLTGLGAAGCTNKEEEQVNSRAKEFAENYFNLRFDKAYGNCTEQNANKSTTARHSYVASFAKHLPPIRWNSKKAVLFRKPHISSLYGKKAAGGLSEWKAHCKMQSEIPLKVRMNNRVMMTDIIIRRMNGFHTSVQT